MYKMSWHKCTSTPAAILGDAWLEYKVDDLDAKDIAVQEITSGWNGELKKWAEEANGGDLYPPDTCLALAKKSIEDRNPIGFTVYFIENAFRLEPVSA